MADDWQIASIAISYSKVKIEDSIKQIISYY